MIAGAFLEANYSLAENDSMRICIACLYGLVAQYPTVKPRLDASLRSIVTPTFS
jgi:hypothetical protein